MPVVRISADEDRLVLVAKVAIDAENAIIGYCYVVGLASFDVPVCRKTCHTFPVIHDDRL